MGFLGVLDHKQVVSSPFMASASLRLTLVRTCDVMHSRVTGLGGCEGFDIAVSWHPGACRDQPAYDDIPF